MIYPLFQAKRIGLNTIWFTRNRIDRCIIICHVISPAEHMLRYIDATPGKLSLLEIFFGFHYCFGNKAGQSTPVGHVKSTEMCFFYGTSRMSVSGGDENIACGDMGEFL